VTAAEIASQSALSAQSIVNAELARGQLAWTGPQGAADAFALMAQHWNVDIYSTLSSLYTSGYQLERMG
jgi:hypothetical protein